ncbi:MAG: 2-phospho-L-lactate guanylyltransferase [Candidatus Bathyarchaeota archaeon]|nr:2-phospho-L-lactate guanylyltransferase [Candidatus Bathyarchaeota archaeon]MCZ2844949.1 2-phospho-L-lactate guanylyltransferase [Candidatus Bathyarchaeota archaeon]
MLIPVKSLNSSKSRLSSCLSPIERRDFTLAMLKDIISSGLKSGRIIEILVISYDTTVLKIAKQFGAKILKEKSQNGLNNAIKSGIELCLKRKAESVIIHPVDIPLATSEDLIRIVDLKESPGVIIIPSKGFDGTTIMMLSPPHIIPTKYGKNSFIKHIREALKKGIYPQILNLPNLSLDIDNPQDFLLLTRRGMNNYTRKFFEECKSHQSIANQGSRSL